MNLSDGEQRKLKGPDLFRSVEEKLTSAKRECLAALCEHYDWEKPTT